MGSEAQRDPFLALAGSYEDWFESPLGSYVLDQQLKALERLLGSVCTGAVIEVGAGTGAIARPLASWGYTVTAVEPSDAMREEGERRSQFAGIEWRVGCAEELPFPRGRFDGAVFFTSLEFVGDPRRSIQEAQRVVRPGGWLAVATLHAFSPWVALYRAEADRGVAPWLSARFYCPEEVEQIVGRPADRTDAAAYLAPAAPQPFDEADAAGQRAGNAPSLTLALWRSPM